MVAAKGWDKGPGRKLLEYDAQYQGREKPLWHLAWRRFSTWMVNCKETPRPNDVRMSFGWQATGNDCSEENLRKGRVLLLEKDGRYFVAVMMKDGWWGWNIIEKHAMKSEEAYNRIILSRKGGCEWATISASMISELVMNKQMCLFELEADDVFKAVTGANWLGANGMPIVMRFPKNVVARKFRGRRQLEMIRQIPCGMRSGASSKQMAFS